MSLTAGTSGGKPQSRRPRLPTPAIVAELQRFPGRTVCDIARALGVPQRSLGSRLCKLCQAGIIRRELRPSPYYASLRSWHYFPGPCQHQPHIGFAGICGRCGCPIAGKLDPIWYLGLQPRPHRAAP